MTESTPLKGKYMSLDDIYAFLCEHEDITLTVPRDSIDRIRRGISKRKHKDKQEYGDLAPPGIRFECKRLQQTEEELSKGFQRIRLMLIQDSQIPVAIVQVNDDDDL